MARNIKYVTKYWTLLFTLAHNLYTLYTIAKSMKWIGHYQGCCHFAFVGFMELNNLVSVRVYVGVWMNFKFTVQPAQ